MHHSCSSDQVQSGLVSLQDLARIIRVGMIKYWYNMTELSQPDLVRTICLLRKYRESADKALSQRGLALHN